MANKGGEIRKTKCMFEKNVEIFFLEVVRWISPIIVIFIFETTIFLKERSRV